MRHRAGTALRRGGLVIIGSTANLYARYYIRVPEFRGGTAEFHELCRQHYDGGSILEIGPGASNPTTDFLATLGPVIGVDIDDEARRNNSLTEFRLSNGDTLAADSASQALCVSNYVLEHISDPVSHFREVARVLAPGGAYVFRTPNLLNYAVLASRILPHAVHRIAANPLRGLPRSAHEPWVTKYRANTTRRLSRLVRAAGLDIVELRLVEKEPPYGHASPLVFFPMMLFERIVNSSERFAALRSNIYGVVRRRAA